MYRGLQILTVQVDLANLKLNQSINLANTAMLMSERSLETILAITKLLDVAFHTAKTLFRIGKCTFYFFVVILTFRGPIFWAIFLIRRCVEISLLLTGVCIKRARKLRQPSSTLFSDNATDIQTKTSLCLIEQEVCYPREEHLVLETKPGYLRNEIDIVIRHALAEQDARFEMIQVCIISLL